MSDGEPIEPPADATDIPIETGSGHTDPGTGSARLRELMAVEEQRAWQRRLLHALTLGLAGWSAYLVVDLLLVFVLEVAPPLYLGIRLAPALALGLLLLWLRKQEASAGMLRAIEIGIFTSGTAAVTALAVLHQRGLESGNVAGAVLVVLTYGVTLGQPIRRALVPVGAMALSIPAMRGESAVHRRPVERPGSAHHAHQQLPRGARGRGADPDRRPALRWSSAADRRSAEHRPLPLA